MIIRVTHPHRVFFSVVVLSASRVLVFTGRVTLFIWTRSPAVTENFNKLFANHKYILRPRYPRLTNQNLTTMSSLI